jgi:hypothetical protein
VSCSRNEKSGSEEIPSYGFFSVQEYGKYHWQRHQDQYGQKSVSGRDPNGVEKVLIYHVPVVFKAYECNILRAQYLLKAHYYSRYYRIQEKYREGNDEWQNKNVWRNFLLFKMYLHTCLSRYKLRISHCAGIHLKPPLL